jgi:RND superfamily putative drug exporter
MSAPAAPSARRERLTALTDWAMAHSRKVVAFWVVTAILGVVSFPVVTSGFSEDPPARDGSAAAVNQELQKRFGSDLSAPVVAVATLPRDVDAGDPRVRADLRALERRLARAVPGALVASYGSTADRAFLSPDGRTALVVAYLPEEDDEQATGGARTPLDAARQAMAGARVAGAPVAVTGRELLERDDGGSDEGVIVETLVAALAALAVLVVVFASPLALLPLVIAAVAIPSTFLAVLALMAVTDVSFVVLFLVALIGLGIAIDYALIVVTRWREEREAGADEDEAVREAMRTAGHAVVFSGCAVAVGLLAAVTLPIPFLRTMGFGGLLIPTVSVAVTLTLLPVLLRRHGVRADRRRLHRTERAERRWAAIARSVVRHRWIAIGTGVAVLGALCVTALGLNMGKPPADRIGGPAPARAALEQLERTGVGAGALAPIPVLSDPARVDGVAAALREVDGVRAAVAPVGGRWRQDHAAVALVLPRADPYSAEGHDVVAAVRDRADTVPGAAVGGWAAEEADFVEDLYDSLPMMVALISLITYIVLARAFRSLLLPLKAIVVNVVSVFAAWGLIALVWQHGVGVGPLFGADATGSVISWVPVMTFAFLYGLSMDYEVFTLARIREERDRGRSTDAAVVTGIAHTGRLVTSAALIVFFAFATMAAAGPTDVKMLATGLGGGILLDAIVVRTLLVPALVSAFGRWNWWLPEPARRLLLLPRAPETRH